MPIDNGYTTLELMRTYLFQTHGGTAFEATDATDDSLINDLIESASRAIDHYCGRTFYERTETRKYDTPSGARLWLDDDLLSVTTLTNGDGDTLTVTTDYVLVPYNVSPKYAIDLVASSGIAWQLSSTTNSKQQAISLAGTWGYSETIPSDVELACLILAGDAYRKRTMEELSGAITPDGVRILPAGFPLRVRDILRPFMRFS